MTADPDVLVVGGGHNGLVAAILAALAGRRVTVLDRAAHLGGASVGEPLFPPHPARLSRYAYLVSLMPEDLVRRLGIRLDLASRPVASFTPVRRGGRSTGLLVERRPGAATEQSFVDVTGSTADLVAWRQFYGELAAFAGAAAPAFTGRLLRRSAVRDRVVATAGERIWTDVVEEPIGAALVRRFADNTVRGVVATDALIGTHASLFDPSLVANRCFAYHVLGRGTGEWLVPVGGMGAVADALIQRARGLGVEMRCGVEVMQVDEDAGGVSVAARTVADESDPAGRSAANGSDPAGRSAANRSDPAGRSAANRSDPAGRSSHGRVVEFRAKHLLAAVAPAVVHGWLGRPTTPPRGAQIKINMLLHRLPRLASGVDPRTAFAGTTHLEQGFWDLEAAYALTASGTLPPVLPSEVYCHSITDPSILHGRPGATLTLFGLHASADLFRADPAGARTAAAEAALGALQMHLAEPLVDCLARDWNGRPCLDIASPLDLQDALGMPGGHIFHGDLSWPWLENDEDAHTPARRYGVEIDGSDRILLAGAGSRRGGGVSGLGGAAAVDALLEMTVRTPAAAR